MPVEHSQVVVAYDFSNSAHVALTRAVALACRAPWHVLQVVCVIDPHFPFPAVPAKHVDLAYAERVQAEASKVIADELARHEATQPIHFFVHARIGKPAAEILGVARDVGADLILLGEHHLLGGIERMLVGSVAEKVMREAGCTVEVVREKTYSYVPLLEVTETPHQDHQYVPPHRYTYEEQRVERRPKDWPLY